MTDEVGVTAQSFRSSATIWSVRETMNGVRCVVGVVVFELWCLFVVNGYVGQ